MTISGKCGADVVWVMDQSGSISTTEYTDMKNLIKAVIDLLTISPIETLMGAVGFKSSASSDVIFLNDHNNAVSLKNDVSS